MNFFMKCANVAFSVVPRISAGDAENLSSILPSVLAYVWHCMFFFFLFFFSLGLTLQHIVRPVKSDRPINIAFVRPSIRFSVVSF